MLVEDPVLSVGLRPIFQSWNFVFSNANLIPRTSGKVGKERR
jgi:hypothetical protein